MKILNKIGSILCSILLVAVFAISSIGQTLAAPNNVSVNREGVMVSYIGENYKWAKFVTSDGKVAYCMDLAKKWPEKTTKVTVAGEADNGVRYILENGYPNKSIYGNKDVDRFITQAAIWWYLADTGQTAALDDDFTTKKNDFYTEGWGFNLDLCVVFRGVAGALTFSNRKSVAENQVPSHAPLRALVTP